MVYLRMLLTKTQESGSFLWNDFETKFGLRKIVRVTALLCGFVLTAAAQVAFQASAGRIEIRIDGKPFSNLYYGSEWPQPFLHPLRAASGLTVTRGYPVEQIAGESQDHIWHHGLWFAHGDINGVDFWRDRGADVTGRIVAARKPEAGADAVSGLFRLAAPGNEILGSIEETFRFRADRQLRIIDVHVRIRADQGKPLKFGDTEEGALGIRLRDEFREDRGAVLSNSDGLVGSKNIWGRRAKWVDYAATIGGERLGVMVLDHPRNPKHPTYWHARNYGLCAANPFGEHDFLKDPSRDGSLTVPAGGSMSLRYRVIVHPGALDPGQASEWFAAFEKEKQDQ